MRSTPAIVRRVVGLLWIVMGLMLAAQSAPRFEVASIRPNRSGDPGTSMQILPGGRLLATNANLRDLITAAYQFEVQPFQFVGLEGWMTAERFDVDARAGGDLPPAEVNAMLPALLRDRFNLVMRRETRQMPVYRLRRARDDRQLGSRLVPATGMCEPLRIGPGGVPVSSSLPQCGIRLAPSTIVNGVHAVGTHVTMEQLATRLLPYAQRRVVDETGLGGMFTVDLEFSDPRRLGQDAAADAVSMFTALQEQLGLSLESDTGPVEVLVVESAQRPTEN
jgi:uncharacterized protein (TIGR03435 family)